MSRLIFKFSHTISNKWTQYVGIRIVKYQLLNGRVHVCFNVERLLLKESKMLSIASIFFPMRIDNNFKGH